MSVSKNCKTVAQLIEVLQKCNPEATIIVSEKPGRGAAQCFVYQGYTNAYGEYLSDTQDAENTIPAVEVTADL